MNGTLTVTSTSASGIDIAGGSEFGNGGTFNGNLTDQGVFVIGDALQEAGLETVSDNYTQGSTGNLDIGIGGTTAGTQFSQLDVSKEAMLNGELNLALISGFTPTLGEMFEILTASSVSGTFSSVTGTSINSSEHFSVIYNSNNVTLDVVSGPSSGAGPTSTSEPASLLLLATGLAGVLWRGCRVRSANRLQL